MKEALMALLKTLGIDLGDKAKELEDGLDKLEKTTPSTKPVVPPVIPPATPPTTPVADDAKDKTILALTQDLADVKKLLGEMKINNDASATAQKEKLEEARIKKIADLKKKGIESGKITEANWDKKFKAIAEKDIDSFEIVLDDLAVDPHFKPSKESDKEEDQYSASTYVGPLRGADSTIMKAMNEMNGGEE